MKRIPLKALLASSAAAIILATLIAILWRGGVLASAQAALAPSGAERPLVPLQGVFVVTFIFLAAILTAAAVALWGARRALPFIGGGIALLGVLNLVLSRLVETDIAYAPIALAAIGGACVAQIYRLWGIDARLTSYVDQIVKRVYARPAAETKSPGLMSGLKLLETVLPLHEAIVLHAGERGGLDLAARLQPTNISPIEPSRNSAWREGVMLCERAIATGELSIAASPTAAVAATPSNNGAGQPGDATNGTSVALPLRHEGQMMGALLVRLRENFAEEDRPLLAAVGAQLAQDLHRDQTRAKAAQTSKHFQPIFSAESAERRLMALGVVSDLLRKERLIVNLLEEMPDAHAVASLDGTIIYANAHLRQAAELNDAETGTIDLFGLLDRFRSGVFDEPSIAVRRVLQSGEPYERELFFQERNQTLKLRIALVSEPADAPTGAATGAAHAARRSPRPLCLVVSVSDVTKQKEFVSLKSDMVSLMSHELRTPITSINGFAELLVIDEALSEEQREFLMIIRSESQRLSRMLDTFLAVSKLESGEQQSVVKAPLLVNELVQEMVTSFQPLAKKKRIRMVVQAVPSLPPVAADRDLITQAISNLIDNA
ncbi:MAG TPA: HAMP domain-containing sensor histidine kinase, partial [Pyrinomonadaceae bacterium]|nr:HAMP domain-containing sensor histidine kinase [Pyrinomonadaceae bacterium]